LPKGTQRMELSPHRARKEKIEKSSIPKTLCKERASIKECDCKNCVKRLSHLLETNKLSEKREER